ncbi:MAG: ATP-dependent DNA ligase [Candidatus Dormibacterales bacterium]
MKAAVPLDIEPMLAAPRDALPLGEDWEYEPKWDGFRILVYRDGEEVALVSRGARDMTRYFPELCEAVRGLVPRRLVLDTEAVIVGESGLDFDALLQRVHPAESRVRLLSSTTPASLVAFDLLALGNEDFTPRPLSERRGRLQSELEGAPGSVHLTPCTLDPDVAQDWFTRFEGAGLDGVIAKPWGSRYLPGKRGWVKVKHERTADCVVIGFRWSSDGASLGSLLLGLYDRAGELHYVGHTSSFSAAERRLLLQKLEPLRGPSGIGEGRAPGGSSRWSRGRETDWEPVRAELVCEVAYDKLQSGQRFRHATRFLRWRPDKPTAACGFDQIAAAARLDVAAIFEDGGWRAS